MNVKSHLRSISNIKIIRFENTNIKNQCNDVRKKVDRMELQNTNIIYIMETSIFLLLLQRCFSFSF